ncbi:terminase large subunit [Methylocystis sp. MJC1]|uniref:terminase TerL endonuclease subunit n=1 Tax=Methylocystis sp. MJC1 TaxID=2654282 RepID=UPI0013EC7C3D|nr:terminase TerL endonuclease subunit [Methylocystis sp. MJC1]KAF2991143.1 hypothetical protein MJC1_01876 [Methylocystis sp. MJC1]MBU6525934.1 terminase large subunit [Methylocystis sp. MJC1]UZX12400.1 terminase large subunit [Methylocystis sp. MJC1]
MGAPARRVEQTALTAAWNFAVPDWRERIREGRSLIPDLPIFRDQADRAVAVFNRLRLADVKDNPTMESASGQWFREIAAALLGSVSPQTLHRMVPELFALVPKKNSKTTGGALLMLAALILNERPNAAFLFVAPTKLIAELSFNQALGAIALDPYLSGRFHVQNHIKKITDSKTGGFLQIKSFDPNVLTGTKPVGALIDEVHLIGTAPEADRVIRQLRSGMISQPEAFLAFITTQSERPPAGVFKRELTRARDVRDGRRADALLAVLYEFPEEIGRAKKNADGAYPWEDPALWPMVTPNLGRSITIPRLYALYQTAKQDGEAELIGWASQHLNIEVGLGLRSDRWVGADHWADAGLPGLTLETLIERCDVAVVGIDGGGLDDLLGLGVIGRDRETREWLAWGHAFAFRAALARRKSISQELTTFETEGDLTIVETLGEDVKGLVAIVRRLADAGLLPDKAAIGLDPAGVGAIVDALAEAGIDDDQICGVSQGYKLMGPMKTLERKLADASFWHTGSGLLAWAVSNAKVELKGNAALITKAASGTAKIDPLMALFDAAALMSMNPEPSAARQPSIYEEQEMRVLRIGG